MKCVAAGPHPVRWAQRRPNKGAKNGFIQLKTYMDNSFCNEICIHQGSRKYHCQQLYPVQGPDSRPKGPHQNGFIQLKTYMENSFCNGICIH